MAVYQATGQSLFSPRKVYEYVRQNAYVIPRNRHYSPVHTLPFANEIWLFGAGMLSGTLTIQGAPTRERVVVSNNRDLLPRASSRADKTTGAWRVYPLPMNGKYLAMSVDRKGRFNAVVADGLVPVPWEDEV